MNYKNKNMRYFSEQKQVQKKSTNLFLQSSRKVLFSIFSLCPCRLGWEIFWIFFFSLFTSEKKIFSELFVQSGEKAEQFNFLLWNGSIV